MTPARALTIAGSDPTGGAGIQQDLKTFEAHGVWGATAITAVTVQGSSGVSGWYAVPPGVISAQIESVVTDLGVGAAKTGMLPDVATIQVVAQTLDRHTIEALVVDPVMAATAGGALTTDDAVDALRALMLPRALLVTPNAAEATRLTGVEVSGPAGQAEAARALRALGARAAIVTGGDLGGDRSIDVLVDPDGAVHELVARRAGSDATHGTGCALSAAITAGLAKGGSLADSCRDAKAYVARAIERAVAIGTMRAVWGSRAGDDQRGTAGPVR